MGSILGSGNILSWILVMESFLWPCFPSADSSRAVVNYWRKDVHIVLVNCLGSLPRNSVFKLPDCPDMAIAVEWDVKPQIKQNRNLNSSQSFSASFRGVSPRTRGKKKVCLNLREISRSFLRKSLRLRIFCLRSELEKSFFLGQI